MKGIDSSKTYGQGSLSGNPTMKLCAILCCGTENVTLHHLRSIVEAAPDDFGKQSVSWAKAHLVAGSLNHVYCRPEEAATQDGIPAKTINSVLTSLRIKTFLTPCDDLLNAAPYFAMAMNLARYITSHAGEDAIDYIELSELLVNITKYHYVFAKPEQVQDKAELSLMKAIDWTRSRLDDKSMWYADLCTAAAFICLSGFWYDDARRLLEEASAVEDANGCDASVFSYTNFTWALYYMNYGLTARGMEYAYMAYKTAADEEQRSLAAIFIAYELCLLEEFKLAEPWRRRAGADKRPQHHVVRIFGLLAEALSKTDSAEECLDKAESLLNQINPEAPLKAWIHYTRSVVYAGWGLSREAGELYRQYAATFARHYASTDGGFLIYAASEVVRLTDMGAYIAAKQIVNEVLEGVDLTNPFYAVSVRSELCVAYIGYMRATGRTDEAERYTMMGRQIVEVLSRKTATAIRDLVSDDELPVSLSGETMQWLWEYQHLLNMMTDRKVENERVGQQIKLLTLLFPSHKSELEVMEASLLDANEASRAWHTCITKAPQGSQYEIAILCARYASAQGMVWEAADFYEIALHTDGFRSLDKCLQVAIMTEAAAAIDDSGVKEKTEEYWRQLEAMACGTPLMADVCQTRAYAAYNCANYKESLNYIDKALELYQPEAGLIDERLASLLAYKCNCHRFLGNIEAAYAFIVEAGKYIPDNEYEGYNLLYSQALLAALTKKYGVARKVLRQANELAMTEEEMDSLDELADVLALPPNIREKYIQDLYGTKQTSKH